MLAVFFLLLSLSLIGISNFAIVAFEAGYGMSIPAATLALTAYLGASAAGVLAGGVLADRVQRYGLVAAACFGVNAVLVGIVALVSLPIAMMTMLMGLAGFFSGLIAPSRDMLVRNSAPPGAMGRVFGLVTTGFSVGGIVGPLMFATVMDLQLPRFVFVISAIAMVFALVFSLAADRKPVSSGISVSG
jgi:MFS family permease